MKSVFVQWRGNKELGWWLLHPSSGMWYTTRPIPISRHHLLDCRIRSSTTSTMVIGDPYLALLGIMLHRVPWSPASHGVSFLHEETCSVSIYFFVSTQLPFCMSVIRIHLVTRHAYLEGKRVVSKSQVLNRHKPSQKDVGTLSHKEGQSHHTVSSRFSTTSSYLLVTWSWSMSIIVVQGWWNWCTVRTRGGQIRVQLSCCCQRM